MQQFLRLPEVQSRTGLKRSTIYLRMSQGKFPRAVQLGSPQAVGWIADEIDRWCEAQVRAARQLEPSSA